MKVLIASADDPNKMHWGGGKHVHLKLLVKALRTRGHSVTELYPEGQSSVTKWQLRLIRLVLGQPAAMRFRHGIFTRHFANAPGNMHDIVNAHDVVAGATIPGRLILTLHGYFARELLNYSHFRTVDRDPIFKDALAIEHVAVARALAVIAVDSRIAAYVHSEFKYPKERIYIIPNAVDVDSFTPVPFEERLRLRKAYGVGRDAFVVLVPRRLVRKNGVVYAVRAMAQMDDPRIVMCIAGDGPERDDILRESRQDTRIRFLGLVRHSDIVNWYRLCNAVLIPSIPSDDVEEATSLSMLEGMACGQAVVCTSIGGMKEVVRHMETGLLVPPANEEAIADAIRSLATDSDLCTRLGEAARAYVVANHSYLRHGDRFIEVYKKVLSEAFERE